jgi:hypothetical protein
MLRAGVLTIGLALLASGGDGTRHLLAWILIALPLLAELAGSIFYLRRRR